MRPLHAPAPSRTSQIFQPPRSPASTVTSSVPPNAANDYFSQRSRKRQRPGSSGSQHDLPDTPGGWREEPPDQRRQVLSPSWVQCPTPTDRMYGSTCEHSGALVNERYTLRGGFDTPGLMASGVDDRYNRDADMELRKHVRDSEYAERGSAGHAMVSGPLARERNGVARMPSSPNGEQDQPGWAIFAFSLVGKVFHFGSSVFKGFYAGGGKGYDFHQNGPSDSWMGTTEARGGTPVPGSWQDDGDFLGDYEQDSPIAASIQPARPPNKRRQTDRDAWVLVGTRDVTEPSPKRKSSSNSVPRSNMAMRPPASRPSSRRSLAPVSRRTSSYTGSPAIHRFAPSVESENRRASLAPTRSPGNNRPFLTNRPSLPARPSLDERPGSASGISPEAEKYLKRQARQDKAADKTIGNMNRQLKDLIAQAQQALGTKYEVDNGGAAADVDMDEGFVDEEW